MATREFGLGLYDVCRPATSPTRRGAAKGRPAPRVGVAPPQRVTAFTPSPPRPLDASSTPAQRHISTPATTHQGAAVRRVAAVDSRGPARAAAHGRAAPRASTAPHASPEDSPAFPTVHPTSGPSPPHRSPTPHEAAACVPSTYEETCIRCLVHLDGVPVLLPSLLEILHQVLRQLQQERVQRKGQEPRRRPSRVTSADVESEVVSCLVRAAQAPSLTAAAEILEHFLVAHKATSSPPTSTSGQCAPTVLIGAALADLVISGRTASCSISPASLLLYLDAAVAAGHPGAMVSVGVCLRDGKAGVERDVNAGLAWMHCAAAAGYLPAMHELGETYEVGVPQPIPSSRRDAETHGDGGDDEDNEEQQQQGGVDWGQALRWYRQASEAGFTASQLNLAKLLFLAAEQGRHDASADATALAHLTTEAKRWLQSCAAAGVEEAVRLQQRMRW